MKILNAFSASMLPDSVGECEVSFRRITDPAGYVGLIEAHGEELESAIGHADTAAIVSGILGIPLTENRVSVKMSLYERALLAQYAGPRLPAGTTSLPVGASLVFWVIQVLPVRDDEEVRERYKPLMLELSRYQQMSPEDLRRLANERESLSREKAARERDSAPRWCVDDPYAGPEPI